MKKTVLIVVIAALVFAIGYMVVRLVNNSSNKAVQDQPAPSLPALQY